MLALRGILGAVSTVSAFLAVENMGLSVATVVNSMGPMWTGVAVFLLGRGRWGWADTVGCALCLAGVVVLAAYGYKNTETPHFITGLIAGVVSSVMQAMVNLTIRDIHDEDTAVIALYPMVLTALAGLPGAVCEVVRRPRLDHHHLPVMVFVEAGLLGVVSFTAQMLRTRALQTTDRMGVVVLRYAESVFAAVWDALLLHHHRTVPETTGVLLILGGCLSRVVVAGAQKILDAPPRSDESDQTCPDSEARG
jgi:drug/metabolite transporter (DMT)-like permease